MTDSKKERTSITIDPDLLERVRNYCKTTSVETNSKVSFSEVVSKALVDYIGIRVGSPNVIISDVSVSDTDVAQSGFSIHCE